MVRDTDMDIEITRRLHNEKTFFGNIAAGMYIFISSANDGRG